MNTFKNILIAMGVVCGLAFIAPDVKAQTLMSSTTLGAAVTTGTCANATFTLASTSTMLGPGTQNNPQTVIYVDREYDWVTSVVDSTHVTVARCKGVGAAAVPATHANGALVYFANTVAPNPATAAFSNRQPNAELTGSCTATNITWLPLIYLNSGDIADCKNGSSGGQWVIVASGTQGHPYGVIASGFCTGTVGTAETEFLNGAACSGATTATYRYVVQQYGTLANLQVYSSAGVTGGTGKDVLDVLKNGSDSGIKCTMAASATSCVDGIGTVTGHSVAVAPGDVITFQFVTATSDGAANISASLGLY